ncbi:M20 family metallopeptidase [Paenarthrobacter sp. NPDC058040]|uniref:M20 metallopeptidase family protein n=1 Tax=unclassified Paenarthrobacter TaxID=2634190 RepID=UPI0036DF251E
MTVDTSAKSPHLIEAPGFSVSAEAILPDLVSLRRSIHADPEIGLEVPRTQRRVLDALEGLGLEITTGTATTSVVAVLRGALPGPTVLLRGDTDALPIGEDTGLEYAAVNGNMHACGHDIHTAALVGAAHLLAGRRDSLAGNVLFMFQPGEEGFGGAKVMIDEGVLTAAGQRPIAAYALHVGPGPRGLIATRPGTVMAGSSNLRVTVCGRGGHGSQPHNAVDPVPVAAEIVLALQTFVTRRLDVFDPAVITVTQLSTGEGAINVIADQVKLGATVRTMSAAALDLLRNEVPPMIDKIASAHNCTAETSFDAGYPALVNDSTVTSKALDVLRDVFGEGRVHIAGKPAMSSEDFSYVLDEIPGTYFFLLASPPASKAAGETAHSPRVVFDDSVLSDGATALAELAWATLGDTALEK